VLLPGGVRRHVTVSTSLPIASCMKLGDLCAFFYRSDFPTAEAREHPEREAVVSARSAVTNAVHDDEFLTDCMARELDLLEQRRPRHGLVPFYTESASGIRFALGFWPPGRNAGAHEHTAWTITAVCRNQLVVQTFDRQESYRRQELVPKNLFDASAGRVGFIYEPCIHDPRNPTNRWSLSLHVTSPRDGKRIDDDLCLPVLDEWGARRSANYDDPYAWVAFARHQQTLIHQVARFLAGTSVPAADDLLARCRSMGSAVTRRYIDSLGRNQHENPVAPVSLTLTHADLILSCRDFGDSVALGIETPSGWVEQMRISLLARDAVAFCASRTTFDVDEIPGRLTSEERSAIADALVATGTFRTAAG
jgi:hypothetical protein